jgi:hypothetical protein
LRRPRRQKFCPSCTRLSLRSHAPDRGTHGQATRVVRRGAVPPDRPAQPPLRQPVRMPFKISVPGVVAAQSAETQLPPSCQSPAQASTQLPTLQNGLSGPEQAIPVHDGRR